MTRAPMSLDGWTTNATDEGDSSEATPAHGTREGDSLGERFDHFGDGDPGGERPPGGPPSGTLFYWAVGGLVAVILLILASAASRQPTVVIGVDDSAEETGAGQDGIPSPARGPGTDGAREEGSSGTARLTTPRPTAGRSASAGESGIREEGATPTVGGAGSSVPVKAESSTRDLVARVRPSVVQISQELGNRVATGSGFVFDEQGHVATNDHVVKGGDTAHLWLAGGREVEASVVGRDPVRDLAILAPAEALGVPALALGQASGVALGDDVLAFGFPMGMGGEVTVTTGIVSSLRAEQGLIQISAAVNQGCSGGPVVRRDSGHVVAVIQSKISGGEGLGFAVPVEALEDLMSKVLH